MIFSTVVAASALALLPSSLALAIGARKSDCTFVCPQNDAHGNGLSGSNVNGNSLPCTYAGNLCIYNIVSVHLSRTPHMPVHTVASRLAALSTVTRTAAPGKPFNNAPRTIGVKARSPTRSPLRLHPQTLPLRSPGRSHRRISRRAISSALRRTWPRTP